MSDIETRCPDHFLQQAFQFRIKLSDSFITMIFLTMISVTFQRKQCLRPLKEARHRPPVLSIGRDKRQQVTLVIFKTKSANNLCVSVSPTCLVSFTKINHDNPYSDNVTLFQVKCFSGAWFLLNCCEVSPIWLSPIALFVATVVQIICFSLTLVHRLHNELDNQNSLHCLN